MHPLLYLKVNIFIHYEQSICFLMMSNFVTQKQRNTLIFWGIVNPSHMVSCVEEQEAASNCG